MVRLPCTWKISENTDDCNIELYKHLTFSILHKNGPVTIWGGGSISIWQDFFFHLLSFAGFFLICSLIHRIFFFSFALIHRIFFSFQFFRLAKDFLFYFQPCQVFFITNSPLPQIVIGPYLTSYSGNPFSIVRSWIISATR